MRKLIPAAALSTLLFMPCAATAMPLADWRADDLMLQAAELRKTLTLNANQQILWDQTTARARAILRARQSRRDGLQARLKQAAANPATDLRDVVGAVDADADASLQEDRQLRELWLTMNDALDDEQRRAVLVQFQSMLERTGAGPQAPGTDAGPGHGRPRGGPGGSGRGRGGMQGGLGAGAGSGPGGMGNAGF
jgi:hypothetical protein